MTDRIKSALALLAGIVVGWLIANLIDGMRGSDKWE